MVQVHMVDVDGVRVKTTWVNTEAQVNDQVHKLLHNKNGTTVIGLDTEWQSVQDEDTKSETDEYQSQVAILQLCNGDSCVIIQLQQLDSVPVSLFNFLRLLGFTFVGIGIKESIAKLEKEYGIGCKNAVELGPFAASVMGCLAGMLVGLMNWLMLTRLTFTGFQAKWCLKNGYEISEQTTCTICHH